MRKELRAALDAAPQEAEFTALKNKQTLRRAASFQESVGDYLQCVRPSASAALWVNSSRSSVVSLADGLESAFFPSFSPFLSFGASVGEMRGVSGDVKFIVVARKNQ